MHLNWRQRLDQEPRYRRYEIWPLVNPNCLQPDKKRIFLRNQKIIIGVLNGTKIKQIAKDHDLCPSSINYLLNRALAGFTNEEPNLNRALVPGTILNSGLRKTELGKYTCPAGARGSFQFLLKEVEGLKDYLDKIILCNLKKQANSQNLTPYSFHQAFIQYLQDHHWPSDSYPFTHDSWGRESARKYFHARRQFLSMPKKKTINNKLIRQFSKLAYDEIQIDSQVQDVSTSIHFKLNGTLIPLRLSRVSLLMAKDVATDCIISYVLCLRSEPCQEDILELLENIYHPWAPLKLKTPRLKYNPGACLPSALGDEYRRIGLNMIRLDNAMCNHANSVRDYICDNFNATLNHGIPANPKGRNFIEYGFKRLTEHLHRFPSTTGSHPTDPIKESKNNFKKPPVLTLDAFEEILSVLITNHNVRPQSRLGSSSPIELIRYQMSNQFIRMNYSDELISLKPFRRCDEVKVNWYGKGTGSPFVTFYSQKYKGDGLADSKLINKKIVVEYDIRDIRTLNAFDTNGNPIGQLYAPCTWQMSAHSIKTRKIIMKLVKKKRIAGSDPLNGYFNYLIENKELPKVATELARISKDINNSSIVNPLQDQKNDAISTNFRKLKQNGFAKTKIPKWKQSILNGNLKTLMTLHDNAQ